MHHVWLLLSKTKFLYLTLFAVIVCTVLVALYVGTNQSATKALLEETLRRQLVTTETAAVAIEEFIDLSGRSLVMLGENYQRLRDEKEQIAYLDRFVMNRKNSPIVGVAVTNAEGMVVQNSTELGTRELVGVDLSDREAVQWTATAEPGGYFVSNPVISRLGTSKGKKILNLAVPIFRDGTYDGAIVAAVVLERFADIYLNIFNPIGSQVYLLNTSGEVLVGPNGQYIGENIFGMIDESPFPGSDLLKRTALQNLSVAQPGSLDILLPIDQKLTRSLITYAPVTLESQTWMLAIVAPASALLAYSAPLYIQQLTLVIAIFFLLLFLILTVLRVVDIQHDKKETDV